MAVEPVKKTYSCKLCNNIIREIFSFGKNLMARVQRNLIIEVSDTTKPNSSNAAKYKKIRNLNIARNI